MRTGLNQVKSLNGVNNVNMYTIQKILIVGSTQSVRVKQLAAIKFELI